MKLIELKTTESKVHAVTVFQADRAEVVRLCNVELTVRIEFFILFTDGV